MASFRSKDNKVTIGETLLVDRLSSVIKTEMKKSYLDHLNTQNFYSGKTF